MPARRKVVSRRGLNFQRQSWRGARITEIVRGVTQCSKFKGICITHVESFGTEPNWFAHPVPQKIPAVCQQAFITALGQVRREFDLLVEP
jgi:hypothetical protein